MWISISENYECSDEGHIRNKRTKHVLREFCNKRDGYMRTQFDGKTQTVHRIVAKAFVPNPENKQYVNHKDGNKSNNRSDNLEWCTFSENIKHAYRYGLNPGNPGERNGRCRLNQEQVQYIRTHHKRGDKEFGTVALANKYGVAHQTISAIVHGYTWQSLTTGGTA